jgi:hypothetical protein
LRPSSYPVGAIPNKGSKNGAYIILKSRHLEAVAVAEELNSVISNELAPCMLVITVRKRPVKSVQ